MKLSCISIYIIRTHVRPYLHTYIQEINNARRFLSFLNGHLARATSIMLFILLTSCFNGKWIHMFILLHCTSYFSFTLFCFLSSYLWFGAIEEKCR